MATPFYTISHAQYEIRMHLYLRQVVVGSDQNQAVIAPGNPDGFGMLAVNDWTVIDAPNANANIVGRAKGMHLQADQAKQGWYMSFNMQFQDARFKGSTLHVMGIFSSVGEWSIVGGTGEFAMARGTINYKIIQNTPDTESIRDLDIHAFYTPKSPPAVEGTMTTANTTGQSEYCGQ